MRASREGFRGARVEEDIASRNLCVEKTLCRDLVLVLEPTMCTKVAWAEPEHAGKEKQTQKAPARFRPCHTAEQCSSEFKLGEQRGRRLCNTSLIQVEQGRSDKGRCQYRSPHGQCVRLTEWEYDDNFSGCEGIFFEKGGAQRCAHSQHSKLPEVLAQWC